MDNIILIGMPGVGKSTLGVILAKVKGYDFVDSDILIQKKTGKKLKEIIDEKGIEGFIETENKVNSEIECDKCVIATGGSVVYGAEAMDHLKKIGKVVYLKQSLAELSKRLSDIDNRGVVLKKGQTLQNLYEERSVLYEKYADIVVDEEGLDIEETLKKVLEKL
ncbi:MAG: shikimate kinase [Lachnospiraceae bacterium]|nr:shikimate kinase [Lachnospiraceae bacterium]